MKQLRWLGIIGLALPAFGQYAGPAILSRGEAPAAMASPKIDFSFSVALSAGYTTGLSGVSAPNSDGVLADNHSYGETLTFGMSGSHSWKRTSLGVNYSGGFSHYNTKNYFDGLSQGFSMGLTHQMSKHTLLVVRESAGLFSQFAPSTLLNSAVPFDPTQSYVPTTDFYDNRTIYSSTQATVNYQKSNRLSFAFGGGFFGTYRRSAALFGANGLTATSDVQYRISKRTTIGGGYGFSTFSYSGSEGRADVQSLHLSVSVRLSRWTEFSFFGGAAHVDSRFQQTVPIDPAILAILCPSYLAALKVPCAVPPARVIVLNTLWSPEFGGRLSRSFQRGVAYLSVGESITPGNGLFLTSRTANATVGYGYTGLRHWSLGASVRYDSALSLGNIRGDYGQWHGGYSVSRTLIKSISFVSSMNATRYRSTDFRGYNRTIYSFSVGLGYSSKNIPVRFF